MTNKKCYAYVSSWSHGESTSGLRSYEFDAECGTLRPLKVIDDKTDFNVSCVDSKKGVLYALDESTDLPGMRGGGGGGRIFAYRLSPETGDAVLLSCTPTCCACPSFLTLDSTGKYLLVSNNAGKSCITKLVRDARGGFGPAVLYDDATVELFAVNGDGSVGSLLDAAYHFGSGPDRKKQSSPHPHSVVMSPDGTRFAVCDKGNDNIYMYKIEGEKLVPAAPPFACTPGSQPRYCAFHPTLPVFYNNSENATALTAYRCGADGALSPLAAVCALTPENQSEGTFEQQGLCISRDGSCLYDVIRLSSPRDKAWKQPAPGADCGGTEIVAVFRLGADGIPELVQNVRLNAFWARGCTLSPDGRFLAVCGMRSGSIMVYAVEADGRLGGCVSQADQPCACYISFFAG